MQSIIWFQEKNIYVFVNNNTIQELFIIQLICAVKYHVFLFNTNNLHTNHFIVNQWVMTMKNKTKSFGIQNWSHLFRFREMLHSIPTFFRDLTPLWEYDHPISNRNIKDLHMIFAWIFHEFIDY